MTAPVSAQAFCCPACAGPLSQGPDAYACAACDLAFPVLFGIPDFRLRPDRYLSLPEEREKARRLHDYAQSHSFEALVAYYYSITDDVAPDLARVYAGYVHDAEARAAPILRDLGPPRPGDRLLDLGCGGGGLLAAAARAGANPVGLDVALRWLVIAQKRLQTLGLHATLVCAEAEHPPFRGAGFSHVVADDVLEHARDPERLLGQAAAQLAPGGRLWVSASNRFWIGPNPSVGLWGAGFLPRRLRSALLRRRRGVDSLRHVRLVSPFSVARVLRGQGLDLVDRGPKVIDPRRLAGRGGLLRAAGRVYAALCRTPGLRQALFAAGPAFQIQARKAV